VEVFGVGRSGEVVWRRRRHEVEVNDASFAEALEAHGALTSKRF
jgi:Arc/MetJ family transcription regulator